jgi:uncharacterized membrane protein YdjX (TVP38/TMEM64 family)
MTRIVSFAALTIILLMLFKTGSLTTLLQVDQNGIRELANNNSALILLFMLVIMAIQNIFTIIPLIVVISVNISLYGFLYGYLLSWISSVIGGTLVFLAARYWFQVFLTNKLNRKWLDKIEKNGLLYVFLGRIFPFVPTSLINITAGVSVVTVKHFIIGTTIGNMLYFFILSLIAYGVMSAVNEQVLYIVLGVVVLLGLFSIYKMKKKRLNKGKQA